MMTKLSLLFFGLLYAATEVEHRDTDDFDPDFDAESFGQDDLSEEGDNEASLDSLLELLKGPNNENAERIAKIREIRASGDESEDSMSALQALFDEILAQMGSSFEDSAEDAEL